MSAEVRKLIPGLVSTFLGIGFYWAVFAIGGLFEFLGLIILIVSIRVLTPQVKGTKI